MRFVQLVALVALLVTFAFVPRPALAADGDCSLSPSKGPVGTVFSIECGGFTPGITTNIYAVEPDGRASTPFFGGYFFFPGTAKANEAGVAGFDFVTEFPGFWSVPAGHYIFVIQELGLANSIKVKHEVHVDVTAKHEEHLGAFLEAEVDDYVVHLIGGGFAPYEAANVWVTFPPVVNCSGFGLDQLTVGALPANGSTSVFGPGTVKADANGDIEFTVIFGNRACIGEHAITVRSPSSGTGAEAHFRISGLSVTASGGAAVSVAPDKVAAYFSFLTVSGVGFPGNTGINCWFTRPDGRVLEFLNLNLKTDGSGSFATSGSFLDDFPPYSSTDPGQWYVTCATPDRSALAIAPFWVIAYSLDP